MNNIQQTKRGIYFPPLIAGRLIRRYQRFLADVELANGKVVTAHCPNTGTMTACSEPGRTIYLSKHDHPNRKLKYTWELIDMPTSLVGVNTQIPNQLVYQAIVDGELEAFLDYSEIQREVRVGENRRLDLKVSNGGENPCYIEIKNCSLVQDGVARFPDAVTIRGREHLSTLQRLAAKGFRTVMLFLINRMDAEIFCPADAIDPAYGIALRRAAEDGIEIMVYDAWIDLENIRIRGRVPYRL